MNAITKLFDHAAQQPELPEALRALYDGDLAFGPPTDSAPYIVGNFVQSLDGIVSYAIPNHAAGAEISGFNDADRFIMALLRSLADAIIIGEGTLIHEAASVYTAQALYPELADEFTQLRAARGLAPYPLLAVLSEGQLLPTSHPVFHAPEIPTLVITSVHGADRLQWKLSELGSTKVVPVGPQQTVPPAGVAELLRKDWKVSLCLHEGGPGAIGPFLQAALLHELFLTISPRLVGQDEHQSRPSLGARMTFTPDTSPTGRLLSLRQSGDFLFGRWKFA